MKQMREIFENIKSCYSNAEQGAWKDGFEQGYQAAQSQQPKGKNQYGLDARYFHSALSSILRNIESYTPDEMYRSLSRLVDVLSTVPAPTMSQFANKADYEAAMQSHSQQPTNKALESLGNSPDGHHEKSLREAQQQSEDEKNIKMRQQLESLPFAASQAQQPVKQESKFVLICNLWVDENQNYVVDRCNHPPHECIAAYAKVLTPPVKEVTE